MKIKIKSNYITWLKLTFIYLFIQTLTRTVFITERCPGLVEMIDVYFDGFIWDIGTWLILSFPVMVASIIISPEKHQKFLNSRLSRFFTFFFIMIISGIAFCEMIFWNEFHSRFNFIEVDYLIYTNEVFTNLKESYPVALIFSALLFFSTILSYLIERVQFEDWKDKRIIRKRVLFVVCGIAAPVVFISLIGPWLERHDENFHEDQLARNGIYEFVRAFRSNKIDYNAFYRTLPESQIQDYILSQYLPPAPSPLNLKGKKPNIVMIVVESLGAKFIGPLSPNKETTPFLNKLAHESMFFNNFYATGTRTVRGLEALNLSVPPTPGYAVVKRPDHKGLFSLGNTFKNNGYSSTFVYGGRGFFDNMNSFFSGNEFKTVDQGDFSKDEISFSNAWGVCDEDLFKKAAALIEKEDQSKPFLYFLLTTSNHRPFTYPAGKINIPSGASRAGAVKYTDYAIGTFLEKVKNKEWAKNTIFIIVADHSTEGRGQFDLEMNDFHIPLWIYSPSLIKPQLVSKLGSQIDLLPTMIHLLNLKDHSPFFGKSLLNPNWKEERAFIGNYQYVGYYKNNILTTLGPNQIVRNFEFSPETKKQFIITDSPYLNEAISYYQYASYLLDRGLYKNRKEISQVK